MVGLGCFFLDISMGLESGLVFDMGNGGVGPGQQVVNLSRGFEANNEGIDCAQSEHISEACVDPIRRID